MDGDTDSESISSDCSDSEEDSRLRYAEFICQACEAAILIMLDGVLRAQERVNFTLYAEGLHPQCMTAMDAHKFWRE